MTNLFWSNWNALLPYPLRLWHADPFRGRLYKLKGVNTWHSGFLIQGCIPFSWSSDPSWSRCVFFDVRSNQWWCTRITVCDIPWLLLWGFVMINCNGVNGNVNWSCIDLLWFFGWKLHCKIKTPHAFFMIVVVVFGNDWLWARPVSDFCHRYSTHVWRRISCDACAGKSVKSSDLTFENDKAWGIKPISHSLNGFLWSYHHHHHHHQKKNSSHSRSDHNHHNQHQCSDIFQIFWDVFGGLSFAHRHELPYFQNMLSSGNLRFGAAVQLRWTHGEGETKIITRSHGRLW